MLVARYFECALCAKGLLPMRIDIISCNETIRVNFLS